VTIPSMSTTPEIAAVLEAAHMRAPYVCKSEAACGVPHSHDMAVFSDATQLEHFPVPAPFTIQEFHNHGAVIFKIYVLGGEWFVHPGPSLPDASATAELTPFNSQQLKLNTDPAAAEMRQKSLVMLKENKKTLVDSIVAAVAQKFGLGLFGLDLLLSSVSGKMYIVDANYFPGYSGVAQFHDKLTDFIKSRAREKQNINT